MTIFVLLMSQKVRILFLLLCLGIFIFPKQGSYANVAKTLHWQVETSNCCGKEHTKECCSTHSKGESQHQNPCGSDCSKCPNVYSFNQLVYSLSINQWSVLCHLKFHKKPNTYYFRFIPTKPLVEIWQPPKIG
ncbi:hypothetical protein [Riemerella anatipestifer]|uniref:hypothetical protein n=2 Tax=Riemerella anatipestifer TaxID=34085 RepID=UPI0001EC5CBD|nr:hypothetical protein [Riemerella anatipestifer]ADQ82440.1 hypothetical protein Riean_1283 [Riemerella anatipestifer ATCC 11845 = DSM 15868]MCO7316410.1 hypothetical protein [Riemerella anatipestifer]MCO7324372.1 hypothetical protein [Riemerella anatipestifer]MCQ4063488.1 hypothetical protein [Riemerella anatipestifer]MCQ4156999.1 hypothetical protein [Riemerella anatipestifer]